MFLHLRRSPRSLLLLVFIAVFLVGCGSFGDLVVPDVDKDVEPPDIKDGDDTGDRDEAGDSGDDAGAPDEPPIGVGPVTQLRGRVVFADTDLLLRATVAFGEKEATAFGGTFQIDIPQGTNTYVLTTRLGTATGDVEHDGGAGKRIEFPAFEGWSRGYFNTMLTERQAGFSLRWSEGAVIPVWIESHREDPQVNPDTPDIAWSVFEEWQEIVGDAFVFERVGARDDAEEEGLIVVFRPQAEIAKQFDGRAPNAIGMCRVFYWREPRVGEISRGEIWIDYEYEGAPALYRHEIGHCIGLNHSPEEDEVMYGVMTDSDGPISIRERHITQLLYSIPPGTLGFTDGAALQALPSSGAIYVTHPDGTVERSIPTHAGVPR